MMSAGDAVRAASRECDRFLEAVGTTAPNDAPDPDASSRPADPPAAETPVADPPRAQQDCPPSAEPDARPAVVAHPAGHTAPETAHASAGEPRPVADRDHPDFHAAPDYYEVLQISPRADVETIHRVFRIMAARFHPDNPVSGDHERFVGLLEAYEVLSRPDRRAQYDRVLRSREVQPLSIFAAPIFVDGLEGEANRRFGVMALLYQRRRNNPGHPGISALELEQRMALPREHLEFTLWYLRAKGYVQIWEENSDYTISAEGVDYVEDHTASNGILRELLAPESSPRTRQGAHRPHHGNGIALAG